MQYLLGLVSFFRFSLFLFCTYTLSGQTSLPVTLINQITGLSTTLNHFVYKDSEGFVWISSTHGLNRYDGKNVKVYLPVPGDSTTIHGHNVNGYFFEDKASNIWFSTYDAINCYLRSSDQFRSYTIPGDTRPGYFACGLDSMGNLLILRDNQLITFNITNHVFSLLYDNVLKGAIRAKAKLNKSGEYELIYCFDNNRANPGLQILSNKGKNTFISKTYFNVEADTALAIRDIWIENDSVIWVASQGGLYRYNIFNAELNKFSPFPEREYVYFNALEKYNDSMLFIATYGLGGFTFNINAFEFDERFKLTDKGYDISGAPQAMYRDNDGGLWISINNVGVCYFHPGFSVLRNYTHTLSTSLLGNSGISPVSFHELPDHLVWVSTKLQGALTMHNADSIVDRYNRDVENNWIANNIHVSCMDSKSNVWSLTARGLILRFPDGEIRNFHDQRLQLYASICETKSGFVILGNYRGGLYECKETGEREYSITAIPTVDSLKTYTNLLSHPDGFVFGTADLAYLDIYEPEGNFELVQSLNLKADVNCLIVPPGSKDVWIGSDWGLIIYSFHDKNLTMPEWLEGLSSLVVYSIVPADQRFIWLSTNKGIYRLDVFQKTIQSYALSGGIGSFDFNPHAGFRKSNGEIWFGSSNGITVINTDQKDNSISISPVNFTGILINDSPLAGISCRISGATSIPQFKRISLPYMQNTITIQFNALNYAGPEQTNYEYRLLGMNDTWVSNQQLDLVRFANLSPGHYTFEVRAVGSYPGSASDVRSLQIDIKAPLYMKHWFVALVLLSTFIILVMLYLWIQRRKEHLQKLEFENRLALESERLRIASDMHDDLGSGISALSLRAKLLSEKVQGSELGNQLEELVHQTGNLSQQVRETIWTINSRNDTVDSLITKLHQYATDYFEGSGIQCEINLLPQQINNPINGNHRREIYLAYKEALHNIQKHSKAKKVTIDIDVEENSTLLIKIHDDGRGFELNKPTNGLGIASMQNRIASIGGSFKIGSSAQGTEIVFRYPF